MNTAIRQVPNHLVWAILATLFCCLPTGIVSIIFAAKVDGLAAAGNLAEAQAASDNAKKWAMWSVAAWFVQILLVGAYVVFAIGAGALAGTSGY